MSITPIHKIKITHIWQEISRTWSDTDTSTAVYICQHCSAEKKSLILGQSSGRSLEESVLTKSEASWGNTVDRCANIARLMNERFDQLVNNTTYDTIDDLIREIDKRCQGAVDGSSLPYWQLQRWIFRPKRYKVRNLIEFVQGPVCNRCDRIFSGTVQPTLDHINGDRSNAHPSNLQLLCKDCNGDKGKRPPNGHDKSPFTYEGSSCEHTLTCVQLNSLQSDREDDEEELG